MDGPSSPYCSYADVGTDVPIKIVPISKLGNVLSTVFIVH